MYSGPIVKFIAVAPIALLVACSQPNHTATAEPPVSQQQILDRFTQDIWPATSAYNAEQNQGGPAYTAFGAVIDPAVTDPAGPNDLGPLMQAARSLGRQGTYDPATRYSHGNDGLHLADVAVTGVPGTTATLQVCYTYTHYWYVDVANTQQAPGASEATVELSGQGDTWYLRSITDDHVVDGCGSPN